MNRKYRTGIILMSCIVILSRIVYAGDINYQADVRFRYDIDNKSSESDARDRQRLRARLAINYSKGKVSAGLRLATSSNSLQSPHQTLGISDGSDNINFGLDRAFITMKFNSGSKLTLGKTGANCWQQNEIFIDADLSPEGISFTHSIGSFQVNLAQYIINEKNYTGVLQDDNIRWMQGVYKGELGGLNATLAGGYTSVTYSQGNMSDKGISTLAGQIKFGNYTLGFDYLQSDAATDNTGMIMMVKTKVSGFSVGLWYYDVAENSTIDRQFSQDNFPNSVGFNGYRLQTGFNLLENINTDIRYYFQNMDSDGQPVSRFQVNFNVKL